MTAATVYMIKSTAPAQAAYTPYGGARELIYSREHEVIIAGPAETGKTLACCWKVHLVACRYPGAQIAIVRKTHRSLYPSVLQTFARVLRGAPVSPYGGVEPERYRYANGSTVWVGGMDNPDKVLSSERDLIYVNQAEELTLDDWEILSTRVTGRGAVVRYPQIIGDCNPAGARHWIPQRAKDGLMRLITSTHRDNPMLYDPATGEITAQGRATMAALDALTGVRRRRLRDGVWATAEGTVYDMFDPALHVRERSADEFTGWVLGMDEGYHNPAVILLIGVDADGRAHVAREFYRRGVLQSEVVEVARGWVDEVGGATAIVDRSAAGLIAALRDAGVDAISSRGRVVERIAVVQDMLRIAGDGVPRLTIDPACVETINEFESYVWRPERDEPVKQYDHAMDALGYAALALRTLQPAGQENPFYA